MRPLVESFGYTNYDVEGYEADDVIATLAERAKAEGIPVTDRHRAIVTRSSSSGTA
jgi:5'-3' exonuclease